MLSEALLRKIKRRGSGSNLPMAMRYRTLKETSKESVGVYRSHIHGRGLFCNRDIEAGEMVIEYAGELIRSTLTDKRERYYDSRGIGCYMFKIDEHFVVDATMRGNAARFINHSCEPNCYSKVVDILGHKHIIIFALRRIVQGEELTYDYKFPFEDVKIPCSCGSKKCRKYLN
ncbi:AAEL010578-PA [Aedes aegypti]|uniref:AAEL010578-PA n=1 Tax=Aedes aegypti TaxID=7159 RepID=Q16SG1_AEDAE|nr:AAEL010578-PA [Aedes aegypti]